ncbi:unnamed protein product [Effrenium voratum]|uniref:Uncharacterized protein n=1 Tax=Effrenium voratum TaxID=2562239 RepID=A0AA36I3H8_9DINO|nr:unnamed protein product [Effrenium voratum]
MSARARFRQSAEASADFTRLNTLAASAPRGGSISQAPWAIFLSVVCASGLSPHAQTWGRLHEATQGILLGPSSQLQSFGHSCDEECRRAAQGWARGREEAPSLFQVGSSMQPGKSVDTETGATP